MRTDEPYTRRSALQLGGAAALGTFLAGCGGPGLEGDEDEGDEDEGDTPDADWANVDTIELEADVNGWIGRAPDGIADVENPTLELYAGREYEFVWENGDGEYHNLSLHSREEEVDEQLDDDERLATTERMGGEGETSELTFEMIEEVAGYVCEMHPEGMSAAITVHEDENGTETGDEGGGNGGDDEETDGGGANGDGDDETGGDETGGDS